MTSLLPANMQDDSNLALENCMDKAFSEINLKNFITCMPEFLSDEILLEEAKMFHVLGFEGWQRCSSKQEKTTLLRNAIRNHRFKGTVKSIKTSLSDTTIKYLSWQQYDGQPNHFKIKVFTQTPLNSTSYNKILNTITEYKRLSSKMDNIEINTMIQDKLCLNTTILVSRKVII